jgi:hypothetical protein
MARNIASLTARYRPFVLKEKERMKKYAALAALAVLTGLGSFGWAAGIPESEQVRIGVQEICPVSGQRLGVHGQPFKAKIGQEVTYLCCQGCLSRKVDPGHWAKIHANLVQAQQQCPVMHQPLPEKPASTVVNGRIVYVCCPSCTKKIAADPESTLKKIDQLYAAHLQSRPKGGPMDGGGQHHPGHSHH